MTDTDTIATPEPHGPGSTQRENAEKRFVAPDSLTKNLQNVLADFIALSLVAEQAHWNIVGPNFRDLHLNLDEVTSVARNGSDTLAERMRAIHASPDGPPAVIAARTPNWASSRTERSALTTPSTTWSVRSRPPWRACAIATMKSTLPIRRPRTYSTNTSPSSNSRPGSSALKNADSTDWTNYMTTEAVPTVFQPSRRRSR